MDESPARDRPASAAPSSVTIRRDHPDDARQHLMVRVDSGALHEFAYGYSLSLELTPGQHRLHVGRGRRPKTIPFVVGAGERVEFVLLCRATIPGSRALVRLGWLPGSVDMTRAT